MVLSNRGSKRTLNEENWDKSRRKYARNSSSSKSKPTIDCKHNHKKGCLADSLTVEDISDFFHKIHKHLSLELSLKQDDLERKTLGAVVLHPISYVKLMGLLCKSVPKHFAPLHKLDERDLAI